MSMPPDPYAQPVVTEPLEPQTPVPQQTLEPQPVAVYQEVPVYQEAPVYQQAPPPVHQDVHTYREVVTARPAVRTSVATSYGRRYAFDSFVVGLVGLALTLVGLVAVTRAGFNGPMDLPVVSVLGFTHTATLGLIEAGIGIFLLISAASTSRSSAIFFGLVLGVGAFVGAVQTKSFRRSLALESGLAWLAVVAAVIVVLVSLLVPRLVTRTARVESL